MQTADEFSRDEDAGQMFVSHGTMVGASSLMGLRHGGPLLTFLQVLALVSTWCHISLPSIL